MASLKSQVIENAQRHAASGRIDAAIAEWMTLLSNPPQAQDGGIYNTIADLYLRKNDKERAVDTCLKAASIYKETGFELKGVAVLKKIFKIDPDRVDIHEKLADIDVERGLTASAVSGYQRTAKLYMERGQYNAAVGVYKKLASFSPEDPEIPLSIARLYQKLERNREAILAYEQAETIYESKMMPAEARRVVEEIVQLNPNYIKHLAKKETSVAELDAIASPKDVALSAVTAPEAWESLEPACCSPPSLDAVPTDGSHVGVSGIYSPDGVASVSGQDVQPEHQEGGLFQETPSGEDLFSGARNDGASIPSRNESDFLHKEPSVLSQPAQVGGPSEGAFSVSEHRYGLSSRQVREGQGRKNKEAPHVSEVIFQAHLAEVDVYLRYGLNQNAIDKLLLAKELDSTREEPYLRLREIYLKEGQNEKAANEVLALIRLYEQQGMHNKREALMAEMRMEPYEKNAGFRFRETAPAVPSPVVPSRIGQSLSPLQSPQELRMRQNMQAPVHPAYMSPVPQKDLFVNNPPRSERYSEEGAGEGDIDLTSVVAGDLGTFSQTPPVPFPEDKRRQYIETCYHLGIAHKEMGNYEKAVREFEQALTGSIGKQFQDVVIFLASCYAESGYVAQSIGVLQRGIDDPRCTFDSRPFLQYELASYFEQLGDRERSFALYKEIYRAYPNFKDVSGKVKEVPYRRVLSESHAIREPSPSPEGVPGEENAPGFHSGRGGGIESIREKKRVSYI